MTGRPGGARVAFLGNVANTHYRAAQGLRAAGIDAHVFVSSTDAPASRPENDDPSLADGYTDWIHGGPWITPASLAAPWRAPVTEALGEFDVVVASGPGPIFAQFSGRPWAFYATGGDLTVKPFPITFWRWYDTWPHRAAELVAGAWMRRAAPRADEVWMQPFAPMARAADRLHVAQDRRSRQQVPIVVDTDAYSPTAIVTEPTARWVDDALDGAGFTVFHPSRLVLDRTEALERTGQWKGNGALLEAVALVRRERPDLDLTLVMPDTPLSRDVAAARERCAALGIDDVVRWLRPPDGRLFDRDHMVELYRRSDVVADEFGVGWFGYVSLEGAAMERPVLCHIDEAAMAQMYPSHPFVSVLDPADVAAAIIDLHDDPEARAQRGMEGRRWVEAYHRADVVAGAIGDLVGALVDRSRAPRGH